MTATTRQTLAEAHGAIAAKLGRLDDLASQAPEISDQLAAVRLELERDLDALDRSLGLALVLALMRDGFTINMAADALGWPRSTIRTWAGKSPEFSEAAEEAAKGKKAWLLGQIVAIIEDGGRAQGQALNIMSHLLMPELRERGVTIRGEGPDPERSAANLAELEGMLGRGD